MTRITFEKELNKQIDSIIKNIENDIYKKYNITTNPDAQNVNIARMQYAEALKASIRY